MANNCYNLMQVFGNSEVKKQVKKWNAALALYQPTTEDPNCARAIKEIFYTDFKVDEELQFGAKWVYSDIASTGANEYELGFVSAWIPPEELEKHIACLMHFLDKDVVVRNSFNIEDGSYGVSYTTPLNDTDAYRKEVYEELDNDSFDDIESAEEDLFARLEEAEVDMLTDEFLSDMPRLAETIKKHMPSLNIDWGEYK